MTRSVGWRCAGPNCKKTANDGPLYQAAKNEYMCGRCTPTRKQHRQMAMDVLGSWVYTA